MEFVNRIRQNLKGDTRKLEQTSSRLMQHELFFLRTWNDISITIISPVCCTFPSFLRASFFSWLHIQVLYIEKRKNQMFINNMDDDCCGRNLRSLVVTSRTERSISRQMNGFFSSRPIQTWNVDCHDLSSSIDCMSWNIMMKNEKETTRFSLTNYKDVESNDLMDDRCPQT